MSHVFVCFCTPYVFQNFDENTVRNPLSHAALRVEWMYQYQGMVILAANQVWWTWEVEDVFRRVRRGDKMALKNYAKKLHSQIDALVVQVGVHSYTRQSHAGFC